MADPPINVESPPESNHESPSAAPPAAAASVSSSPVSLSPAASPSAHRRVGSSNNLHGLTDKTTVVSDGSTRWKKERRDAWDWKNSLGVGSFGEVFQVTDKQTGKDYAAKVMSKRELVRMRKAEAAFAEKSMLTELKHPGIIELFQTFQDPDNLYFILELCPNGDLLEFMNLQEGGRLSEDVARFYLSEIVATLEFIHSKSVYYRDLKLENILLDENYHCKLCDFNTSSKLAALTDNVGSIAGTAEYVPPELIIDQKAGLSGDVWSLGCLIFQLLSGVSPFRASSDFISFQQIRNRDFHWSEHISPTARDLVDRMLSIDPTQRPTFAEMKGHPFFSGVDWAAVFQTPPPASIHRVRAPEFN